MGEKIMYKLEGLELVCLDGRRISLNVGWDNLVKFFPIEKNI